MDLNQLKDILDLVREHELSEFEIEQEGLRLKVRKDCAAAVVAQAAAPARSAAAVTYRKSVMKWTADAVSTTIAAVPVKLVK